MTQLLPMLAILGTVLFINLILSADNVIIIGLASSGLAPELRNKAIFWGIAAATIMRIAFALVATYLLKIVGLTLAGGLLLLWVCWKFWRQLEHERHMKRARDKAAQDGSTTEPDHLLPGTSAPNRLRGALTQIIIADVSMSLDNVLAVVGAARSHTWILIIGLILSVVFMGAAAQIFARLLERFAFLSYLGLVIIFGVSLQMIYDGSRQVLDAMGG
jgi:YjbE family integral membrane protein